MAAYAVGNELYIDQVEIALREQSLYETVNLPVGWYNYRPGGDSAERTKPL